MKNLSRFDFYFDALSNASSESGVLYLARHFLVDPSLLAWQKNNLIVVADILYGHLSGRSIYSDL